MLTDQNKETRKTIASTLLQRFNLEGEEFLGKIVTGDETWVHFFEPCTNGLGTKIMNFTTLEYTPLLKGG